MKFVEVDSIPKNSIDGRREKKDVKTILLEFLDSGVKYAEVIFTDQDYSSPFNARNSISQTVWRQGFPITVHLRDDRVFLERGWSR